MVMKVDRKNALERYSSGDAFVDSMYIAPFIEDITTSFAKTSGLNQSKVFSLDMIANSVAGNWDRPAYFAGTVHTSYYLGLSDYLAGTGMAYEVTPFRVPDYAPTADKSFVRILNYYRWGGLDAPDAENLYLDETVRRMVSSVRSGVYTVAENLMVTGDLPASQAAKDAAIAAGYPAPENRYGMARILLNHLEKKLPAKVTPYDSMLGLYLAGGYLTLYLAEGNPADLEAANAIAESEADRYAQLVKYATTLEPRMLNQLGRTELYSLQFLGEAVALKNYTDILRALPGVTTDPELRETRDFLANMNLDMNLRMAPLVFIKGYDEDFLESQYEHFPENQLRVLENAVKLLRLNKTAGVDAQAFSKQLMDKYGFTADQWNYVLN